MRASLAHFSSLGSTTVPFLTLTPIHSPHLIPSSAAFICKPHTCTLPDLMRKTTLVNSLRGLKRQIFVIFRRVAVPSRADPNASKLPTQSTPKSGLKCFYSLFFLAAYAMTSSGDCLYRVCVCVCELL